MKRRTFSGLLLAAATFLGLAATPAFAIVIPTPPVGCVQVSAGVAPWPAGAHTWRCGSAIAADGTAMLTVLNGFTGMPRANTEMIGLAGSTNRGNFYIFGTQAEYVASSLNAYKSPSSPGTAGLTYNDPGTDAPVFSAVWVKSGDVPPITNQFLNNTVAHELGHWLDALSGAALSKQEKITLAGTVSAGHIISLTISNGNIAGSPVTVTSAPATVAGDTLTVLATRLKNAINANAALTAAGLTASSSADSLTTTYTAAGSGPTYSYSISGAGVTEQVWLDMGAKASSQPLFKHSLHGGNPETATLGGSVTAGNKVTLNFRDAAIPGNTVSITYTVVAGDTLTTIATALKNAVNANANLMGHVTATSAGAVITLTSVSGLTDYAGLVSAGATATITLPGDVPGFNKVANCNSTNTGVFNERRDRFNDYICSTREIATLGGGPYALGDAVLTITDAYADADVNGNPIPVAVTAHIVAADTPTTAATKFQAAITANAKLGPAKISATASGNIVTITSASGWPTTFAFTPGSTHVTMNLSVPPYGRNDSLAILHYGSLASNWTNLGQVAWPSSVFSFDSETFAEEYAVIASQTDRNFPGTGNTNYQSLDWYFSFSPAFTCSRNVIATAGNTRLPPTSFPAGCPVN